MKMVLSGRLRAFFEFMNGNPEQYKPVTLVAAKNHLTEVPAVVLEGLWTIYPEETVERVRSGMLCEVEVMIEQYPANKPIDHFLANSKYANDAGVN